MTALNTDTRTDMTVGKPHAAFLFLNVFPAGVGDVGYDCNDPVGSSAA